MLQSRETGQPNNQPLILPHYTRFRKHSDRNITKPKRSINVMIRPRQLQYNSIRAQQQSSPTGQTYINDGLVRNAIGILSPHAGLIYSGSVAGEVYSTIEIPKHLKLLRP